MPNHQFEATRAAMRALRICVLVISLGGCGTASSVRIATAPAGTAQFGFQDDRPMDQRAARVDTSLAGDSIHFGDDNLQPPPPELLKASFQRQIGPALTGKRLFLAEFSVSVFDPAVYVDPNNLYNAASSVPGGYAAAPLAGLLIHGIERMRSEKIVRVRIEGKVAGHDEFRTVVSDRYRGRVTEENIQASILRALDQAVAEVRRTLAAAAPALPIPANQEVPK